MPGGVKGGSGIVPWHMWGTYQDIEIRSSGGVVSTQEKQITRVSYRRPESWGFLLGVSITQLEGQNIDGTEFSVAYKVQLGLGRSSIDIPRWHTFNFDFNGISPTDPTINPGGPLTLWTNTVANRVAAVGAAGPPAVFGFTTTSWIDTIVFEDLQVSALVSLDSAGEPTTVRAQIHAYFAPRSHVRPEWFEKVGRFTGNEDRGV